MKNSIMINLENPEAFLPNWTIVEEQILYKIDILPTRDVDT